MNFVCFHTECHGSRCCDWLLSSSLGWLSGCSWSTLQTEHLGNPNKEWDCSRQDQDQDGHSVISCDQRWKRDFMNFLFLKIDQKKYSKKHFSWVFKTNSFLILKFTTLNIFLPISPQFRCHLYLSFVFSSCRRLFSSFNLSFSFSCFPQMSTNDSTWRRFFILLLWADIRFLSFKSSLTFDEEASEDDDPVDEVEEKDFTGWDFMRLSLFSVTLFVSWGTGEPSFVDLTKGRFESLIVSPDGNLRSNNALSLLAPTKNTGYAKYLID